MYKGSHASSRFKLLKLIDIYLYPHCSDEGQTGWMDTWTDSSEWRDPSKGVLYTSRQVVGLFTQVTRWDFKRLLLVLLVSDANHFLGNTCFALSPLPYLTVSPLPFPPALWATVQNKKNTDLCWLISYSTIYMTGRRVCWEQLTVFPIIKQEEGLVGKGE